MFDHYVINVAQMVLTNGKRWVHIFATAPHSLRDRTTAETTFDLIKSRFPEVEGYKVTMTHWVCRGHEVEA